KTAGDAGIDEVFERRFGDKGPLVARLDFHRGLLEPRAAMLPTVSPTPQSRPSLRPSSRRRSPLRRWAVQLRRTVITGLLILAPLAFTVYVLVLLFQLMDGMFAWLLRRALGPDHSMPGVGLILTVLVVLLLGWLSSNVFGRRLIQLFEKVLARIPVAKTVYSSSKGIVDAISQSQTEAFKRVVLIEYPRQGLYSIAFVTSNARWGQLSEGTEDLLLVFLPTTPNPTSGYLLMVPRPDAIDLPITVEEGVRMVISGGILKPESLQMAAPVAPKPADDPPPPVV
ncbi:MAG: DUF502 domain-containing protein, partial [Acidobacteriota bacterium]|nr:DUF502 domain-containing protein [Acidobacteriota bacterium]